MKLAKQTRLRIIIVFASLIGVLYAASSTILLQSVRQAEEQQTHQAVEGVLNAFTQTKEEFHVLLSEWSHWNNTYAFFNQGNKNYTQANLYPQELTNLKLNLMLFVQPSGKITYGTGFDLIHGKKTPIPAALTTYFSPDGRRLQYTITGSVAGIVQISEGPMLIVAQPIVTSKGIGSIHGTVVFGRYLNHNTIASLSRTTRLPLKVHGLNETKLPADFLAVRDELLQTKQIVVRPLDEKIIAGYTLLRDLHDKPAAILRVDVSREIYQQGQKSWRYLTASLAGSGLVFGGTILLLLQRLITSRRKWQQSEAYRHLVTKASESIFLVDADTKQILETNTAFETLLGYTLEEIRQLTLYDAIADEYESIDRHLLMLREQHYFTSEQQYRRKDGLLVDVEVNANVISYNNREVFCIIVRDITKRKRIEEQLLYEAFHDSLTGLANRALFMTRLEHAIQTGKSSEDYSFAVLFLDLDRFKTINDSLGHMVGDRLLIGIAQRLKGCLRSSDTFARLGGDEFAAILEACNDPTEIIERIQQELKLPFDLDGQEVFASASIGAIVNTKGYDRPENLLRDADTAMYRAKAGGKARYEMFDVAMHDDVVALLQLETDLHKAVENCEFQLHYQPIVSLCDRKIVGFEALVRWQHPQHGLILPERFISIAEETGLIIPLGWWVLREACSQLSTWQQQFSLNTPLTIGVNFSVKQFAQPQIVEQIVQILAETNLDARNLHLELTETVLMESAETVNAIMQQLKALGISLSLDDFGTGFSSLSYLHRFPIDKLKIDRSFVSKIGSSAECWEIVRAIVMLANALDIEAIAEGIESYEQLIQIKTLACQYGQGYHFSLPLDSTAATILIAQQLSGFKMEDVRLGGW